MKKEEKSMDNSFGTASVILGILSITLSSLMGITLGIIGLVFSIKQKKKMENKWSDAGKILNIIGVILGVIVFTLALVYLLKSPDFLSQFGKLQYGQ